MSDCQAFLNPLTGRAVKMNSETHAKLYRYGQPVPTPAKYVNAKFIRRKHSNMPTHKTSRSVMKASPSHTGDPSFDSPVKFAVTRHPRIDDITSYHPANVSIVRPLTVSSPYVDEPISYHPASVDIYRPPPKRAVPTHGKHTPTVIRSPRSVYGSSYAVSHGPRGQVFLRKI